jgi:hypothetical protein
VNGAYGDSCVSSCSYEFHYSDVNGKCTLKDCSLRVSDSSSSENYPCGPNCVLDVDENCKKQCSEEYHYSDVIGICVLKSCSERTSNGSENYPCGNDGCFQDVNGAYGDSCVSSCSNEFHYSGVNGKCTLKDCTDRSPNNSSINPCGDNCLKDSNDVNGNNSSDNDNCRTSCSNNNHFEAENGICVLKSCIERTPNGSELFACGNECYNYIEYLNEDFNSNITLINSCVNECELEYYDVEKKGICKHISCEEDKIEAIEEICGYHCFYEKTKKICVSNCGNYMIGINGSCKSCEEMINKERCYERINGCYFDESLEKCFNDECFEYSSTECNKYINCTNINGTCHHFINGSVDVTISTSVIGGFILFYFFLLYLFFFLIFIFNFNFYFLFFILFFYILKTNNKYINKITGVAGGSATVGGVAVGMNSVGFKFIIIYLKIFI